MLYCRVRAIATTNAWKNSGNCTNAAQVDAIGSVRKVCELPVIILMRRRTTNSWS